MKKVLLFIAVLFIAGISAKGQQIEQFTQYMLNPFILNPAAAGSEGVTALKFTYRRQWAGAFNGEEPTTQLLSINSKPQRFPNIGLGAVLFNDVTGPSRRTGITLDYAYHVPLGSYGSKLGLGLGATVLQYNIDGDMLNPNDPNDPAIFAGTEAKIGADGNVGAFLFDENYYVGVSVFQLFNTKFVFQQDTTGFVRLARHFYVTAGYKYDVNERLQFEPSVLVKSVAAAPVQFDINARILYDNRYWLGVNFRTYDAIGILAGLAINDRWKIGYSYDLTTSDLSSISSGSHEIMLGIDFISKESAPSGF